MEKGVLKPPRFTKLRRLRRILNVAVRKKLLPSNPCWGVEFPVAVKGLFRPRMFRGRSSARRCGSTIVRRTSLRVFWDRRDDESEFWDSSATVFARKAKGRERARCEKTQ